MEMKEVEKLREAWGNLPCNHPQFIEERFGFWPTGEYICTQCGKNFTHDEKKSFESLDENESIHGNHCPETKNDPR